MWPTQSYFCAAAVIPARCNILVHTWYHDADAIAVTDRPGAMHCTDSDALMLAIIILLNTVGVRLVVDESTSVASWTCILKQ